MILEKISIKRKFNWGGLFKATSLTIFILTLTVPAFLIILGSIGNPTGSPISPLPAGETASIVTPTPTLPFASALNLAQNYLDKAFKAAQNQAQTETDKKQIIDDLNQSLTLATSAINTNSSDPRGYLMRAQILTAISKIKPEALQNAKDDLEIASRLSNGQNIQMPNSINPLNLIPEERASVAQNIIIAAPNESSPSAISSESNSNSTQGITVLTKGLTEVTINNSAIKDTSYIYLIPQNRSGVVSVKSKSIGTFTIQSASPVTSDLTIDYWVINQ